MWKDQVFVIVKSRDLGYGSYLLVNLLSIVLGKFWISMTMCIKKELNAYIRQNTQYWNPSFWAHFFSWFKLTHKLYPHDHPQPPQNLIHYRHQQSQTKHYSWVMTTPYQPKHHSLTQKSFAYGLNINLVNYVHKQTL